MRNEIAFGYNEGDELPASRVLADGIGQCNTKTIIHSWVEVAFEGLWVNLEGFILDAADLTSLQRRFPGRQRFCGYGAATTRTSRRTGSLTTSACSTAWMSSMRHGSNLSGFKRWLYTRVIRHRMNAQVRRMRAENW